MIEAGRVGGCERHPRNIAAREAGRGDALTSFYSRAALALFAVVLLSGCSGNLKQYMEKDGRLVRCQHFGWGILGTPLALAGQSECISHYEKLGYTKVATEQ